MLDADAESLISHLFCGLAPADRAAFRQAAENALATSPPCCWGPGSIHRTVTSIWHTFFRPPPEDRGTTWNSGKKRLSKLVTERPPKDCRVPRRVRIVR